MDERILVTQKLTKRYGSFTALAPTDLELKQGNILGLVGKNGAGKTTLLRMIAGQTEPSGGSLNLFSEASPAGLCQARRRIGAIVESPAFYANLTARENLEYYRIQIGIPDRQRVDYVLTEAGIDNTGKKKYKTFSLGMKQRLGIALALLPNPDFLVLDEPLNGLDPMGIMEMRNLLLRMNREKGITILISSHILSELSSVATEYAFLHEGALLEHISAADLHQKCRRYLEVKVNSPEKAAALLEMQLGSAEYEVLPQGILHLYTCLDQPEKISRLLVSNGIELLGIEARGDDLEDYFMSLVGGERHA